MSSSEYNLDVKRIDDAYADRALTSEQLQKALSEVVAKTPHFETFCRDNINAAANGTLKFSELHVYLRQPVWFACKDLGYIPVANS